MTDQQEAAGAADAGEAPVPGAAPAPAPAPQQSSSRIAELEAELSDLRAAAVAGEKTLLRVRPPHVSFTYAGHTVGAEPAPVPARLVPAMTEAAAAAGVNLEEG